MLEKLFDVSNMIPINLQSEFTDFAIVKKNKKFNKTKNSVVLYANIFHLFLSFRQINSMSF